MRSILSLTIYIQFDYTKVLYSGEFLTTKYRCNYRHVSGEKRGDFLDVYVKATIARESNCRMEILSCSAQSITRRTSKGHSGLSPISRQAGGHWETLATPSGGIWSPDTVIHKITDYQIGLSQAKSALAWKSASNAGRVGIHWGKRY